MRELSVRIRFTVPCLGKDKKSYRHEGKLRYKFVFQRSPQGKVVFLPTWWRAIMLKAANVMSQHQRAAEEIRFNPEVDGQPRKELFTRWYDESKFTNHEYFPDGSVIGLTCIVPDSISDEDFERLLTYAGKYFGISPARPNEFGFFEVEQIQRISLRRRDERKKITAGDPDLA